MEKLLPPTPGREITAAAHSRLSPRFGKVVTWMLALLVIFQLAPLLLLWDAPDTATNAVLALISPFGFVGMIAFERLLLNTLRGEANPGWKALVKFGFHRFGAYMWVGLRVFFSIFFRLFLLIVPGVIAAFNYAAVGYVIIDDPEICAADAMKRSRAIMYGHRWRLFCFSWRFVGWYLLVLLTCGLAAFWVFPYVQMCYFEFFERIKPAPDSERVVLLPEMRSYSGMKPAGAILLYVLLVFSNFVQYTNQVRDLSRIERMVCMNKTKKLHGRLAPNGVPVTAEEFAAMAMEHPEVFQCPMSDIERIDYVYCGHLAGDGMDQVILIEKPDNHAVGWPFNLEFITVLMRSGEVRQILYTGKGMAEFMAKNHLGSNPEMIDFIEKCFAREKETPEK